MDDDLTIAFVRSPTAPHGDATVLPLPSSEPSPTSSGSSETWGSFKLLARVGSGGFGEVYRAWDPHLQREVALKLLLPSLLDSEVEYDEVLREARALAAVRHNNVVPIYGVDRHDGRVGFWTGFVHGSTLSAVLAAQGPFGYREAALIGIDVAHALSAVHRSGMLHRDIKAENVMREEGGRILLMDFGLSALPQQGHGLAGTPAYMAPELLRGGAASASTDLYAVGVLLFYLVTGKYPVPFLGYGQDALQEARTKQLFLIDLRPDLPESFLRTVAIAIDPDPQKRFATAGQLSASLGESLGTARPAGEPPLPMSATVASASIPPTLASSPSRKKTWYLIWAALLFLGGLGLYTRYWASRQTPHAPAPGLSASDSDLYLKAQDLVLHSYLDRNLTAAVDSFNKVLSNDPQFALAHAGLGRAYFLEYRKTRNPELLDQAQMATRRALELDPNSSPAYVTLARINTTKGQTALAMQQAEHALKLDPLSAEAFAAEADVLAAQGRLDDARKALNHAADLAPDDWRFPVLLGNYEFTAGNLQQAAGLYQRAVDLVPDNALAYYNLGDTQQKLGRLDQAQASFEKALQLEPRFAYYSALGGLSYLQGKTAEAIRMDEHAVELNPNDYVAVQNLAEVYLSSPDRRDQGVATYRRAITLAEAARSKSPRDPALLITLAEAYAAVGDKSRSLPVLRQALALAPNDPEIGYRAGETYEILGERGNAVPLLAKALASGYAAVTIERDPRLSHLRSDPAFATELARVKGKS